MWKVENLIRLPRGVCVTWHEASPHRHTHTHYHQQPLHPRLPSAHIVCSSLCLFTRSPAGPDPLVHRSRRGQQLHRGCEAGETWLWWSCQLPVTLKQCGCRVERGTNTHTLTFSSAAAFNIKTRGSLVSDRICKHQYQKANMWFCICRSSTYLKHIRV